MKKLLTVIISLVAITSLYSQENLIGLNIKVYQPISDFNNNIDSSIPAGFSFTYLRQPETGKFSFGAELGIAMYSTNDYYTNYNGQDLKINEEDCFWNFHGLTRYQLIKTERFYGYLEFRAGITTFFSSTVAYDESANYPDEFKFHGTAFNTGYGGGASYKIGHRFWINGGVNFHTGTKTTYRYMPESNQSISFEDGKYKSLTHYIDYKLGVQYSF